MYSMLYLHPIQMPRAKHGLDESKRQDIALFTRRSMELLRAAALIDGSEPGLLTREDRETARRKGGASARRILSGQYHGNAHVLYYRTITDEGIDTANHKLPMLADRIWILDDRCGLADSYLRAVADTALQKNAEVILCPNLLRRDRLEAVILPEARAAYLSGKITDRSFPKTVHLVHLDRIPDVERRQALRKTLRENKAMIEALVQRAVIQIANAALLSNLNAEACANAVKRI